MWQNLATFAFFFQENLQIGSKRPYLESRPEETLRSTPESTTSSGSFIPLNRHQIRARRSQFTSAATQTQDANSIPLTTLNTMIPVGEIISDDMVVVDQIADLLKETNELLSTLLHGPNPPPDLDDEPSLPDENIPSSSAYVWN